MKLRFSLNRRSLAFTGVFLISLRPASHAAAIIASDGAADDYFGYSVSLSGNSRAGGRVSGR